MRSKPVVIPALVGMTIFYMLLPGPSPEQVQADAKAKTDREIGKTLDAMRERPYTQVNLEGGGIRPDSVCALRRVEDFVGDVLTLAGQMRISISQGGRKGGSTVTFTGPVKADTAAWVMQNSDKRSAAFAGHEEHMPLMIKFSGEFVRQTDRCADIPEIYKRFFEVPIRYTRITPIGLSGETRSGAEIVDPAAEPELAKSEPTKGKKRKHKEPLQ